MIKGLRLPVLIMALRQMAGRRLRNIVTGIALFIISAIIVATALIALLVGMFFSLTDYANLVKPSLITGLIAFLVAAVIAIQGTVFIKKP